ncbi:MAG TPA: DUF58 domain-containing protein [Mycobacteriales bacterium]|jgi:uncharacterized protein (DUF58 family)|nr:DUF58 domain-containing protein [Mycobacteriales bacterium]
MGAALSGLTLRGRCLLAAGIAASLSAAVLGEEDLLRIGIFLVALPLVAVAAVARTRYRLTCERRLDPARVAAGIPATVRLRLHNVSRLPTGVLLVEDTLPWALGERPRFVVDRMEPEGVREVSYPVLSHSRGRFRIGPLTVRLTDPFGLCELSRSFRAHDTLMVTPAVVALPVVRIGGDRAGGGDGRERSVAVHGEDDVAVRDYRQGDDLRRVHWRSTARTGELMVRREEQPWLRSGAVLLDTRAHAHLGDGPGSSFEWAISAAASAAVHLARGGYRLRMVTDSGVDVEGGVGFEGRGEAGLLDALAVVEPSGNPTVEPAVRALRRASVEGVVVAVLGAMDSADLDAVTRLRSGRLTGVAVLLDTISWAAGPSGRTRGEAAYDENVSVLRRAGWRVLAVRHGDDLARIWPQAAGGRRAGVGV